MKVGGKDALALAENPFTRPGQSQLFESVLAAVKEGLGAVSVSESTADRAAAAIVGRLYQILGGETVYFSKAADGAARRREIHKKICDEFNGRNVPELARRYGYCTPHVYVVLKRHAKGRG